MLDNNIQVYFIFFFLFFFLNHLRYTLKDKKVYNYFTTDIYQNCLYIISFNCQTTLQGKYYCHYFIHSEFESGKS